MSNLPPLLRQVVICTDPLSAFRIWTQEIDQWWPVADGHSVYGAGSAVAFSDGKVVETSPSGETAIWGEVLDWQPPDRLRITWHPGAVPERASEVEVRFASIGDGSKTLVTLIHSGWERFEDPSGAREEYSNGWIKVLDDYTGSANGDAPHLDDQPAWLVLSHVPGPSAAETGVFAHPDFAEHIEFLRRLDERGVLVAAGSLTDAAGEGMTILRVPVGDDVSEYVRLAHLDDQSVVRNLLNVTVRPWNVQVSAKELA